MDNGNSPDNDKRDYRSSVNWEFCPLHEAKERIIKFFHAEWLEIESQEYPEPEVDWQLYDALSNAGMAYALLAKCDGVVVGYNAFMINRHIHYPKTKIASQVGMYLEPEFRKGFTGINLIKRAEQELTKLGVNRINYQINAPTLEKILRRLGYEETAVLLTKRKV